MTKVKTNLLYQQITRNTGANTSDSNSQKHHHHSEVDMMPSSFRDQMSFQYKTNNSSLSFICKFRSSNFVTSFRALDYF